MAEDQALFPFEIDLQDHGGKFVFFTDQELLAWIEKERKVWAWFQKHTSANPFSNIAQKQVQPLNDCYSGMQQVSQCMKKGDFPQAKGHLGNIRNTLVSHYHSKQTGVYSDTAKAEFINRLQDQGQPRMAMLILGMWINADLNGAPIREAIDAGIERVFYEKGIRERAPSEKAALAKLAADMQNILSEGQQTQHEHSQKFAEQEQALITLQEDLQKQFAEAQQERGTAWTEQLDDCEKKLNHLRKTYDDFMAIQSPVRYWEQKRIRHQKWSLGSGAVTLGAMAGAWFLLSAKLNEVKTGAAMGANKLAASQPAIASKVQAAADASGSWHFDVAVLVLLGTLSFWVIRLLVRVFLSHLHLENDAAERATMARTYLALLRRGKLPEGDDLKTVLAALFRPSGDGIVKDEGMPPSMVDFLTKLGR